jgi:predicted component of type VI protein secretion system
VTPPLAALIAVVALAGCGGAGAAPKVPKPVPIHLQITAGKDTNRGGLLYVVVRKIDAAGFLAENYDAIADGLFGEPRDAAVVRKAIVRPGEVTTVEADRDLKDGEIFGVYFLFSVPGESWRLAIQDPKITRVAIVLGATGIASVEQRP